MADSFADKISEKSGGVTQHPPDGGRTAGGRWADVGQTVGGQWADGRQTVGRKFTVAAAMQAE
jgi:hypothetical protein